MTKFSLFGTDDITCSGMRNSENFDPPSSGVILIRANLSIIFGSPDCVSTPVCVLTPTLPSATKVKLSSTTSLPAAPHSSPSESASQPVPPRRVRDQRFPAVRPPEQLIPTPAKANFRDDTPCTPLPDRVPPSYCPAFIRVTCPCPRCYRGRTI